MTNEEMTNRRLWPRTPVNNIQCEIWRRCGASDWNIGHPRCRARLIVETLGEMIENYLIEHSFSVVDLFCGDAVVLTQIKRALPGAVCLGVDVREYAEHETARAEGVNVKHLPVQVYMQAELPFRFDVAILLNTWRGWDRAGLVDGEADLPERVEAWLRQNARYIIVTATGKQVEAMKARGWWVWEIGPGEDESRMVGAFWSGIERESDRARERRSDGR